ncbi:MAG: MBL fold metallo-hydrolase [Acidobacteriota bacterium]
MLGSLFQCDPDLRLTGSDVYLDPRQSRPIGVISHGHSDHIGRHEHFIATAATAAFLRIRQGDDLRGTELSYRKVHALQTDRRIALLRGSREEVDTTVELFPAGHILGSAMIRLSTARGSLAYTGDFKLSPSFTAEPTEVPRADAIVMESTYGSPEWIFPSREELRERLISLTKEIVRKGKTAVLLAYSLGKAQETAAMLRASGLGLVMHRIAAQLSAVYERHGVDLGDYEVWDSQPALFGRRATTDLRGKAIIVPPHMTAEIRRIPGRETIALTGWALNGSREADHALPLSDHADFQELVTLAETSGAAVVYVTHGSKRFAAELRRRGIRAEFLKREPQMRLF